MRLKAFRALAKAAPFRPLDGLQAASVEAFVSSRLTQQRVTGANPGGLEMFTYIPPDLPLHAPLVVMLHGCGQTAAGYDGGTGWSLLAEELKFAVLAPQQVAANNPGTCLSWFDPGNNARDHGEVASIRAMIEQMVHAHRFDPARIYITGLSAGGAMTAAMLAAYPDMFAGGAIIAGLAAGSASSIPDAFRVMRHAPARTPREWGDLVREASPAPTQENQTKWPTVSIWQGDADTTVDPHNGEALAMQWTNVHGLLPASATLTQGENFRRRSWAGVDGKVAVELVEISGMGHGVPVGGLDAYGRAGPYFLDAGLSSTAAIARFWGFKVPVMVAAKDAREAKPVPSLAGVTFQAEARGGMPDVWKSGGVRAAIMKSLKSAGLIKR